MDKWLGHSQGKLRQERDPSWNKYDRLICKEIYHMDCSLSSGYETETLCSEQKNKTIVHNIGVLLILNARGSWRPKWISPISMKVILSSDFNLMGIEKECMSTQSICGAIQKINDNDIKMLYRKNRGFLEEVVLRWRPSSTSNYRLPFSLGLFPSILILAYKKPKLHSKHLSIDKNRHLDKNRHFNV